MKILIWICWAFYVFIIAIEIHWGISKLFEIHKWKGLDAGAWASWVQGIGSIAAIFTAILVVNRQNESASRLATEVEARAIFRRLTVIQELVKSGFEIALLLKKHTEPITSRRSYYLDVINPEKSDFVINTLKEIPLHTIDIPEAIRAVQESIFWLEKLKPYAITYFERGNAHYIFEGEEKSKINYYFKNLEAARSKLSETIIDYKRTHFPI